MKALGDRVLMVHSANYNWYEIITTIILWKLKKYANF